MQETLEVIKIGLANARNIKEMMDKAIQIHNNLSPNLFTNVKKALKLIDIPSIEKVKGMSEHLNLQTRTEMMQHFIDTSPIKAPDINDLYYDKPKNHQQFGHIVKDGDVKLDEDHWIDTKGNIFDDKTGELLTKDSRYKPYRIGHYLAQTLKSAEKPLGRSYFEEHSRYTWGGLTTAKRKINKATNNCIKTDKAGRYYLKINNPTY